MTSPLATIARVIRIHDATSIDPWLALASTACALFWGLYGLAGIQDPFVAWTGFIGAAIGSLQLLAIMVFGRRSAEKKNVQQVRGIGKVEPVEVEERNVAVDDKPEAMVMQVMVDRREAGARPA
jgi:hypothetical protein